VFPPNSSSLNHPRSPRSPGGLRGTVQSRLVGIELPCSAADGSTPIGRVHEDVTLLGVRIPWDEDLSVCENHHGLPGLPSKHGNKNHPILQGIGILRMGNLPECRPESSLVKKSGTTLKPPVCFEIRGSDEHPENRPTAGYSPMFEIPAISFQRQIVEDKRRLCFSGGPFIYHLLH